jgi:hypothetical protein
MLVIQWFNEENFIDFNVIAWALRKRGATHRRR